MEYNNEALLEYETKKDYRFLETQEIISSKKSKLEKKISELPFIEVVMKRDAPKCFCFIRNP